MQPAANSKLASTFAALARATRDPLARPPRLPFLVIALLAVLCSGLFIAVLVEDRQLQRDTMQRDVDLTALQMGTRLASLAESLGPLARDIESGSLSESHFNEIGDQLAANREELIRIDVIDARGRGAWWQRGGEAVPSTQARPNQGTLANDDLDAVIEHARRAAEPFYATLRPTARNRPLALAVPLHSERTFVGALVARIDPHDLIIGSASQRALDAYRLSISDGAQPLASTSSFPAPDDALTLQVRILPLPPNYHLTATALRLETRYTTDALVWVVAGLGVAALVALAALARHSARQQRIDRALRAETSLRRAMEDAQATGLRVVDPQGVIRYVNRGFCQLAGYSETELVGRGPPYPYWPAERANTYRQQLDALLAGTDLSAGRELVMQRPDGTLVHTSVHDTPLLDADNRQIGWMSSATDVTESARARSELAAAHERFTAVLESVDAAVSVASPGTDRPVQELLFANRAYQSVFGGDAAGHARLAERMRGRDSAEVRDDATERWFDVRERTIDWPFRAEAGAPVRLQIATDITSRKAADEMARQQQEQMQFTSRLMTMGEMASSLAHELNQPLTAIANYCQGSLSRLRAQAITSDEVKTALEKSAAQAQRAAGIIRRIRDFVRRAEPRRRATAVQQVVDDAVAFADIEAAKKGIAIATQIDPAVGPVLVDPLLIEQLLLNLLKNAIDAIGSATPRRIDVAVRLAQQPGMAEFSVADTGCGIPDEDLPRLFEPFFTTKAEGMGMGLNICRSIVEFHHGRLTVGHNPAGGTIMRFTLPFADASLRTAHTDNA